ncbi:hypothetical protein ACTSKR_11510 [Chitinibacteraceae bacterium HSL-7]
MAKQILPATPERDSYGYWSHPDYPDFNEGTNSIEITRAFNAAGVASWALTEMEDDLDFDHPAYVRYFEEGEADIHDWDPTPPRGDGWFLLSIYDTEDGPVAVFGSRSDCSLTEEAKCAAMRKGG